VSSIFKGLIFAGLFLALTEPASIKAAPPGFLEGHLKIILSREVELADATPAPVTAENYADYPLIVLGRDEKTEVARVTADASGNYRVDLPPGDYVLDIQRRPRGRVRATPRPFTVVSGQTVRVDMDVDTGVR
jgi:S1-C subfamily serine protease